MMTPMPGEGGYLPGALALTLPRQTRTFRAHGRQVDVAVPRADASHVRTVAAAVQAAAHAGLADLPILAIVDAIDRTVACMLDQGDPERQVAESVLPVITGFDPEMVRLGLDAALRCFRRPQLLRWLTEEFGDPGILDDFRPRARGGWSRAYGPRLLGHAWAGNVPGLPFWSLVSGLLTKSGSVGKVAADEPWAAGWFARTLARIEPRLADSVAILWWPGDDAAPSQALAESADTLVVYGGEAAMSAWRAHAPNGTRVLAHGHKLSAAMIGVEALDTRQAQTAARLAAMDVARWDQQGCYSPQVIHVEQGGQVAPRDFAHLLAGELAALAPRFARRTLAVEEAQTVAGWRQALSRQALAQPDAVEVLGPAGAPWGVAYRDDDGSVPPCALNRTVCVVGVACLDDAIDTLSRHGAWLQTVAVAASPERLFPLAARLGQVGFTRVCALGAAAMPEPGWHHDGRFSLLDLVRMVDVEAGAERAADALAFYRE